MKTIEEIKRKMEAETVIAVKPFNWDDHHMEGLVFIPVDIMTTDDTIFLRQLLGNIFRTEAIPATKRSDIETYKKYVYIKGEYVDVIESDPYVRIVTDKTPDRMINFQPMLRQIMLHIIDYYAKIQSRYEEYVAKQMNACTPSNGWNDKEFEKQNKRLLELANEYSDIAHKIRKNYEYRHNLHIMGELDM